MLAIIALLFAYIFWGAGSPIFKLALTDIPPFTLAFIRFFFASLIFFPFILPHIKQIKKSHWRRLLWGAFWGISINVGFFFLGLKLAPSINATIVASVGPMLLYIFSLRLLHEKAHPKVLRGILVAFFGVLVIVFAPLIQSAEIHSISRSSGLGTFAGNLFFVIGTIGGVMMTIENKKISGKVDPMTMTGVQFFIGSLAFAPFMFVELQGWSFSEIGSPGVFGIVYGIIFSSAFAYFLINYALSKMHAQDVGVFTYIAPVASVIVAAPLLGEFPDIFFIGGAFFILCGVILAEAHVRKRRKI